MEGQGSKVVSCPQCRRYYRLPGHVALDGKKSLRCTKCGHVFTLEQAPVSAPPSAPEGPRVLVASDGEEMCAIIDEVLLKGGFVQRTTGSGDEAWKLIQEWSPQAAVLDVAIPGIPVFEVCDRIRQDERHSGLGIVLLASVYQHTRYKRSPTSLYGADDYIEKHHLRDSLIGKITRLIQGKNAPGAPGTAQYPPPVREEDLRRRELPDQQTVQREEVIMVREERFGPKAKAASGLHDSLGRFARIIVTDIALYNQELIEQGIREGNFEELLAKEIEEGRQLFETRLPQGAGEEREIYTKAIEDFVAKQRARFSAPGDPG